MRGRCSQLGTCSYCGKTIVKFAPFQPWMTQEECSDRCEDAEDGRHKLKENKED